MTHCILLECREVDERSPVLHDEANGEGDDYMIFMLLLYIIDDINLV